MAKSYLQINNYSNKGSLYIATKVFKDIAIDSLKKTEGVYIGENKPRKGKAQNFDFDKYVTCTYKDGRAELFITINLKKGTDVNEICLKIQKQISDEILTLLEQVPCKIKIKVADII